MSSAADKATSWRRSAGDGPAQPTAFGSHAHAHAPSHRGSKHHASVGTSGGHYYQQHHHQHRHGGGQHQHHRHAHGHHAHQQQHGQAHQTAPTAPQPFDAAEARGLLDARWDEVQALLHGYEGHGFEGGDGGLEEDLAWDDVEPQQQPGGGGAEPGPAPHGEGEERQEALQASAAAAAEGEQPGEQQQQACDDSDPTETAAECADAATEGGGTEEVGAGEAEVGDGTGVSATAPGGS